MTGRRAFSWNFSITQRDAVHASAACCLLFRAVRDARDLAKQMHRILVLAVLDAQN
jgi:hypothetical protein